MTRHETATAARSGYRIDMEAARRRGRELQAEAVRQGFATLLAWATGHRRAAKAGSGTGTGMEMEDLCGCTACP